MRLERSSKVTNKAKIKKRENLKYRRWRRWSPRRKENPSIISNNYHLSRDKSKIVRIKPENVFLIILFVILLILAYFEGKNDILSNIEYSDSNITIVLGISYIGLDELERSDYPISIWEKQFLSRFNSDLGTLILDHIYVPDGYLENKSICVKNISIQNFYLGNETSKNVAPNTLVDVDTSQADICLREGKNYIFTDTYGLSTVPYENYSSTLSTYYFPFDERLVRFNLLTNLLIQEGGQNYLYNVPPEVKMIVSPKWQQALEIDKINDNNSVNLSLLLKRPITRKIVTISLPIVFILVMFSMPKIKDEGFWEVVIGLLSLWGVQDVLIPNYINSPTIISNIFFIFYIIFGLVMLYELYIERRSLW